MSSKQGEVKRVALTTISSTTTSFGKAQAGKAEHATGVGVPSAAFARFGAEFLEPPPPPPLGNKQLPTSTRPTKTIRLELKLFESDSEKYPEFNFVKLIHLEKKKNKLLKQKTGAANGASEPFGENNDDVERIAKELEKKYGTAYVSARSRNKPNSARDIAMGYDVSDSFIDNSEAFDEEVPDDMETMEGGFYINCGALQYKNLNKRAGMSRTDEIIKMPDRPKKRTLSTSSEGSSSSSDDDDDEEGDSDDGDSENEDEDGEDDDSDESDSDSDEESAEEGEAEHKVKTKAPTTQEQELAKKAMLTNASANANEKKATKAGSSNATSSSSNSPKPTNTAANSEHNSDASEKNVKTTTIKDMLKAKRDSFLKSQGTTIEAKLVMPNGEVKCASTEGDGASGSDSDITESTNEPDDASGSNKRDAQNIMPSTDNSEKFRAFDTQLPPLEAGLLENISAFKEQALSRTGAGKKLIFDDKLSALFRKLDDRLLKIDKTERNLVFAHLEFNIPLPKYFLLRKSKQLLTKEEKYKGNRVLSKLRKLVADCMPQAVQAYSAELRKFGEMQSHVLNTDEPPKMPLKRFPWNTETREALFEIYQVRKDSFGVLGTRKDTLETFINTYLKERVLEIWPNGWMRSEELQREIDKLRNANANANSKKSKKYKKENLAERKAKEAPNFQRPSPAQEVVAAPTTGTISVKRLEDLTITPSRLVHEPEGDLATAHTAVSITSTSLKRKKPDDAGNKAAFHQLGHQPNNKMRKTSVPESTAPLASNAGISQLSAMQKQGFDMSPKTRPVDMYQDFLNVMAQLPAYQQALAAASVAQSLATHSKPAATSAGINPQLITVDGSQSASDILKASQQLATSPGYSPSVQGYPTTYKSVPRAHYNATPPAAGKQKSSAKHTPSRNGSESSESDSVEIVGVYTPQAARKLLPQSYKRGGTINKSAEPSTSSVAAVATAATLINKNFNIETIFGAKNNNALGGASTSSASSAAATGSAAQNSYDNVTNHVLKQIEHQLKQQNLYAKSKAASRGPGTSNQ